VVLLAAYQSLKIDTSGINYKEKQGRIFILLLVVHGIQFIYWNFRRYDISRNGELDKYGNRRARKEQVFGLLEFFIICIAIGFSIHALIEIMPIYYNEAKQPMLTLWIIIDCLIMFFMQSHVGVGIYFMFEGEISKNFFTLFFIQS
jgi:hypothetical protein